jgi:shikimate kinase
VAGGPAGSSAGSSATGMTKPKSMSPTLCLLEIASVGVDLAKENRRTLPHACDLACAPLLDGGSVVCQLNGP